MVKRRVRSPHLDGGVHGWIIRTARRHHWRVQHWIDLDDLIQEGFLCYVYCVGKYSNLPRQQFMGKVQRAFSNRITDLANTRTATPEKPFMVAHDKTLEEAVEYHLGADPSDALFAVALSQLPADLRGLLRMLQDEQVPVATKVHPNRTRETNNEYLCRLIGADPAQRDLEKEFKDALVV